MRALSTLAFGKECNANAEPANITTIGATVRAYATCNANDTQTEITTGPIQSSSGIYNAGYSLFVPDNASIGTYLIDISITSESLENAATLSGLATYVLTVNVND